MQSKMKVIDAGKIEMELTVSMTLDHWVRLREQLGNSWPSSDLRCEIDNMVRHADKHFRPVEEKSDVG